MLHHRVDLCQVLWLPPGDATEQQVQEGAAFVAAESFAPQESLLVVCQTAEGETVSEDVFGELKKKGTEMSLQGFNPLLMSERSNKVICNLNK